MCGITGFIDFGASGSIDRAQVLRRMTDTLRHRGPDDDGYWLDPSLGLALGHRRLSIVDLSPHGRQPMLSANGRYVVAFNGEIYNYKAIREELEDDRAAPNWQGHSDTEVLLAAITRWGVETAIGKCVGMFAIALWDRALRQLHLIRDRLGEKPIYYGRMGNVFLFGSELKALRAHPAWDGIISREALTLLLRHNYIPSPFSIYEDVRKLSPGTILTLSLNESGHQRLAPDFSALKPKPYWSALEMAQRGAAAPLALPDTEAVTQLERLLSQAIGLQMVADVPLGAFLSGGIDSSTVVALMQAQSSCPVKTFSIGFNEDGYDEAKHAAAVAHHLGTDHTELYVTPRDALAVIPRLPTFYDEPFSDSSQIPTFLVAQLARRHVTVSLSGDAGDELFGGYNRYLWCRDIWRRIGKIPPSVRTAAASGLSQIAPQSWDSLFGLMGGLLPKKMRQPNPGDKLHKLAEILSATSPEKIYLGLISHWKNPSAVVVDGDEPTTVLTDTGCRLEFTDLTLRMMYLDLITYLPDDILVKVDRAAMSVGLETRIPLLDHRVVEFAWRVPLSQKIRGTESKWLLRQVLYRHVPRELIERPKMGFGVPIDSWLRGPLREWAEELLAERRLRSEGYFNPEPIREKWAEHLSGNRNWQYYLWDVLMFQAWLENQKTNVQCCCDDQPALGSA